MTETRLSRAVLLVDITGSTPLYETVGDRSAALRIMRCIDWMHDVIEASGGIFVEAKGDDVLGTYEAADAALAAVEKIIVNMPSGLTVHAGLHFGDIVATQDRIFGDTVNVTARLAALANPGEALISRVLVSRLSRERAAILRPLNAILLKGKSEPMDVFSLNETTGVLTAATASSEGRPPSSAGQMSVLLEFDRAQQTLKEGASVSLGREPYNDIVVRKPWVSRRHAMIAVKSGHVQLTDRSLCGSYLAIPGTSEWIVRRETVVIAGAGRLSLGISVEHPDAAVILFEVGP